MESDKKWLNSDGRLYVHTTSHPMESCAYNSLIQSQGLLSITKELNIAKFLFAIPEYKMILLSIFPGSELSLHAEVTTNIDKVSVTEESPAKSFPRLLKTPLVQRHYGRIDDYDVVGRSYVKTGSDKWMLPGYIPMFEQIINDSEWLFNDISKLNGGIFKPHSGHKKGIDVDLKFPAFQTDNGETITHDFSLYTTDDQWRQSLIKIENFILGLNDNLSAVSTIFVTNTSSNKVRKWFHNRCIGSRFVDLDRRIKNEDGELIITDRPLIKHVADHSDHIHLGFNEPNIDGLPTFIPRRIPEFSFTDLVYSLSDNGGSIDIWPKDKQKFTDYTILWRLQDREGYSDFNMVATYGNWNLKPSGDLPKSKPIFSNSEKFLYVVIAHRESGGCIEKMIPISTDGKFLTKL